MEEASVEGFRTGLSFAFLAILPVVFQVISPIAVADAAHEFGIYRIQHYDLHGNSYGCSSAIINAEARTLQSSSYARRCVMIRSNELTYARYLEILDQGPNSLLILLHGNMSNGQVQNFIEMERKILSMDCSIPIYFAYEDEALIEVYDRVTHATKVDSGSALQALMHSATSVGYQLVTSGGHSKSAPDQPIVNIEGVLPGLGVEDQLPSIAIVAHYDSFGAAPYLSYGANSDASGVVALLELAKMLGKLYSSSRTHPRYNILFLLSGGGKFNYQGTKKWIEEAIDNVASANIDSLSAGLLANTKLILCLESIAHEDFNALRMHVSKPPSEGTMAAIMHSNIQTFAKTFDEDIDTSLIHKKIRLSTDSLAWEHERFSIRRLPAVTLSSLDTHENPIRRSMMDTKDKVSVDRLARNTEIIAESIVSCLYNVTSDVALNLVGGEYIQKNRIQSWLDFLASQPRPAQAMGIEHPVVTALEAELQKHLKGVHRTAFKPDRRDPEFMFYDGLVRQMSASIVRSAVFDLYITGAVAMYMALIYLLVLKFNGILFVAKKLSSLPKVKVQ